MLRDLLSDGVTYRGLTVRPITLGDEADFVAHVQHARHLDIIAMQPHLQPDEYAAAVKALGTPLEWGAESVQRARNTEQGLEWFARRALVCDDPTFTALWSDAAARAELISVIVALNQDTIPPPKGAPVGTPISDGEAIILLEARGYRRDEIRRLTRRYVRYLLTHDEEGVGKRPTAKTPRGGYENSLRQALIYKGLPRWRIDQIIAGVKAKNDTIKRR